MRNSPAYVSKARGGSAQGKFATRLEALHIKCLNKSLERAAGWELSAPLCC
jgi:hypothetical protein